MRFTVGVLYKRKKGKTTMKKTLLKALSSTLAVALVATAALATAPVKGIPAAEIKAPVRAEKVADVREERAETVLEALERKAVEEKVAEVKEAEAPAVEIAKAEPIKAAAPVKAEEVAAPAVRETAAPAEEAPAPEVLEEAEPVMVWDISATEEDNVVMAFYAENTEDFVAADPVQVDVDKQTGIVTISGEGAMDREIYRYFMTVEKYLTAVKAVFEEHYGEEVDLVYDEDIEDVLKLDATIRYYSHATGEELYVTEEMRQVLNPYAFLEYSPRFIIIEEGITNIANYAFACCADLEAIRLPSTIEYIGENAFTHCNRLEVIEIPEDAAIKAGALSYCYNLSTVRFLNANDYAGIAVEADEEPVENTLSEAQINALVNYWS